MLAQIRQAIRPLLAVPGFSAIVVLTSALGIGTATAVFSLVYGVLLRPYPYAEPDRLVRVQSRNTAMGDALRGMSLVDIDDYRRRSAAIEDIGAYTAFETQVVGDGAGQVATMSQLNPAALKILGVAPVVGRLFEPGDDIPGGDVHKALISHALWHSRFGGSPDVVGQAIHTDRRAYTIVGVMPPGFGFPARTMLWTPMESWYASQTDDRAIKRRDARFYATVARLKPGVSLAQAESELNRIAEVLEREHPVDNRGIRVKLTDLRTFETGELRPYLFLLLAGVGLVLLVCCANVAALLLVRATSRQREITIRAALGASRSSLVRTLLAEALLLSVGGGVVGVGLAHAGVNAVVSLIPVTLPFWMVIEVDRATLAFAVITTMVTAVLFGLAPALHASRVDVNRVLKEGSRGSSSGWSGRATLVVAEVALSIVLLVCAALLLQTLARLQSVRTGFTTDNLLTIRIVKYQAGTRQESAALLSATHTRVLESIRRVPGVSNASVTNALPFTGTQTERSRVDISIKGRSKEETKTLSPLAGADVSPDYFATMGIPLVRGRLLNESDTATSPKVVLINERGAKLYWPGRDPIGEEILWGAESPSNPYCRVVGVVGDVRHQAAEGDNGVELYYPITQWPIANSYYVVRVRGDAGALAPSIRSAIESADPAAAVAEIKSMQDRMAESVWEHRLWGTMFGIFAALALGLAGVGLFGVMSHAVAQRTREIGIRMALGAKPGSVGRMIIKEAMLLVGAGAAVGIVAALAVGFVIRKLLFGVGPFDPAVYVVVALVLAVVAVMAAILPARRAYRVDPIIALRSE